MLKTFIWTEKCIIRWITRNSNNNAAERAIKPFDIGRKNFLFANTAKGSTASAKLYSIIETAKANKVALPKNIWSIFSTIY